MADLQREAQGAPEALLPDVRAARDADRAERNLGRAIAVGLPVVTVASTILVAIVASVGSALLVLAAGVLLGTIGLLWASVRTLSGDAPLPLGLETVAAGNRRIDDLAEQKRRVLRSLKDIENEHAIEKIDDADYEQMASRYRDEAKRLMREMDENVAPAVAEAELLVSAYFGAIGLTAGGDASPGGGTGIADAKGPGGAPATAKNGAPATAKTTMPASTAAAAEPAQRERLVCAACATSNDTDAAFCKKCGATIQANGATAATDAGSASKASED